MRCDLENCEDCSFESNEYKQDWPTCNACEDGYALTTEYYEGDKSKKSLVCKFEYGKKRRDLNCQVSDLFNDGCEKCNPGYYYSDS